MADFCSTQGYTEKIFPSALKDLNEGEQYAKEVEKACREICDGPGPFSGDNTKLTREYLSKSLEILSTNVHVAQGHITQFLNIQESNLTELETKMALTHAKIAHLKRRQGFKDFVNVCKKPLEDPSYSGRKRAVQKDEKPIFSKVNDPANLPAPMGPYTHIPLEKRLEQLNVEITGREESVGEFGKVSSFMTVAETGVRSSSITETVEEESGDDTEEMIPPPPPPPPDTTTS